MSRRRKHFLKVLGGPAAPRNDACDLDTHPSGRGGDVVSAVATLPSAISRDKNGRVCTLPCLPETRDRVTVWMKAPPRVKKRRR